ncbi:hypothetical protein RHA1_ro11260 (plasmid) [Rhodococcus jostii RHA1]|uniref:Uncharacterized protein n=1 Tax=Rhodococcus jostii (strain RHA1) TaxID=101510 RepID=Q0RUX9_RHOJR|nr:hypothetical protein RHA1_ro11260 [Rhodococcus jostii RHA1]
MLTMPISATIRSGHENGQPAHRSGTYVTVMKLRPALPRHQSARDGFLNRSATQRSVDTRTDTPGARSNHLSGRNGVCRHRTRLRGAIDRSHPAPIVKPCDGSKDEVGEPAIGKAGTGCPHSARHPGSRQVT